MRQRYIKTIALFLAMILLLGSISVLGAPDDTTAAVITWTFAEWGTPTSGGVKPSADYVLGTEYNYDDLIIVFNNSSDRINSGTTGVLLAGSGGSTYLYYDATVKGTLSMSVKAIAIREGSVNGPVVASYNENATEAVITAELEAGKRYYIVPTKTKARMTTASFIPDLTVDKEKLNLAIASAGNQLE